MKNIQFLFFVFCSWTPVITMAQSDGIQKYSLDEIIRQSEEKSLDAFKAENLYQTSYLEFKNFRAQRLPTISLRFEPLTYNKYVTQRYDANINRDVYRSLETLNSYAGLTISQNIAATGGNLFLNSNVNRLQNFGKDPNVAYNNNILQIGFNQSLFQYNALKWNKKTAPLVYEKAKVEFIEAKESLHIKAVNLFFDLASAQLNIEISQNNYKNAVKLYEIGKERFKIATINQEELLNLELNLLNAEVARRRSNKNLLESQFRLNSFLGNERHNDLLLEIPEDILEIKIDEKKALQQAKENNSEMLSIKLKELNSLSELYRAKGEGRFNPNFSGSVGLNKSADDYRNSFVDPLNQNRFSLKIEIPIVDWGTISRKTKIAERKNKVVIAENKQAIEDFKQKIITQVIEFNLQDELVENALKAKNIAIKSHDLVLERFRFGNIDIVKLNASISAKDRAINEYINSLKDYWVNYYTLQKLTLVDLKTNQKLSSKLDLELNLEPK